MCECVCVMNVCTFEGNCKSTIEVVPTFMPFDGSCWQSLAVAGSRQLYMTSHRVLPVQKQTMLINMFLCCDCSFVLGASHFLVNVFSAFRPLWVFTILATQMQLASLRSDCPSLFEAPLSFKRLDVVLIVDCPRFFCCEIRVMII